MGEIIMNYLPDDELLELEDEETRYSEDQEFISEWCRKNIR